MELLTIILMGVILALDCFAICICVTSLKQIKKYQYLNVPVHFAIFHAIMLFIGYFLGKIFEVFIQNYDHWVAFILLSAIGAKIIYSSLKNEEEHIILDSEKNLLILSIATSVDALVIGITFNLLDIPLYTSAVIISLIIFIISLFGLLIGKKISEFKLSYISIIAGIVLILLGTKTLLGHLGVF